MQGRNPGGMPVAPGENYFPFYLGGDFVDYNTIIQAIGNLGFPIVCCAAMFWMLNEDRKEHREESSKFVDAINQLTVMVEKLTTKLGVD